MYYEDIDLSKRAAEKKLTRVLLNEWELTQKNSPESSGFFSKVKDFWEVLRADGVTCETTPWRKLIGIKK